MMRKLCKQSVKISAGLMHNRTGGQSVIQYCGAIYKPGMPLRQRSPDTGETVSGFAGGRFYNSIKKHPQGSGLCGCMMVTDTPYYYIIILLYYCGHLLFRKRSGSSLLPCYLQIMPENRHLFRRCGHERRFPVHTIRHLSASGSLRPAPAIFPLLRFRRQLCSTPQELPLCSATAYAL